MVDPVLIVRPIINGILRTVIIPLIKNEVLLIWGIKGQIEKLSANLETIQAVVQDAENRQNEEALVRNWLAKLRDAALDAEDILDTIATEAFIWKQKQQIAKKIGHTFVHAHKIKDLSERLASIAKEKNDFHLVSGCSAIPYVQNHQQTGFFVHKSDVVGREIDKENIIHRLLSDDHGTEGNMSVIPIIGMGGLGKTTIAQLVFGDERVKGHFESMMWVCVSVDFDLTRILKEMIEFHTKMKYDLSMSLGLLQSRLQEFLSGKRFLLVLDDVWDEDYTNWASLQELLKLGGKGTRALVTSRSRGVSVTMGVENPYLLEYLPEVECFSLFERIAFNNGSLSTAVRRDLEVIGKGIVAKCKGLPLAVKVIGGLLRGSVSKTQWTQVLNNEIWEVEEHHCRGQKPKIMPALKLSYDHLPPYLKRCFAYCSIFPKAYVFDKQELAKLWMAEAFVESRGIERAEDTALTYFHELLMRSFFQLSSIENKERYSMHDMIHDLAQSISSVDCCQVKDNESCSLSKQTRHVSILGKDLEQPAQKIVDGSKKLRTFLLPSGYLKSFGSTLDKLFQTLNYLRVMDLSSSILEELPNSIQELKLLRYLDLSRTQIKELPKSICNLYNLQTLKLLECPWLLRLPEDLANLVNLRHLELDEMFWYKLSRLPPRMGSITGLHNLHAFRVGYENGYKIAELKNLLYLTGKLHISNLENVVNAEEAQLSMKENLNRLVLEWCDREISPEDGPAQVNELQSLRPNTNINELQIIGYGGEIFPDWMRDAPLQNLMNLSLRNCTKCRVLLLAELPHLRSLSIKGMHELRYWPAEAKFPSLSRLNITNCPKLRMMPYSFQNLRSMKIKKCNSLKELPVAPNLNFLILVDNLVLDDWKEVKVRSQITAQGQTGTWSTSSFVQLLELKVIRCPCLRALPRDFAPQKLEISDCPLLKTLPRSHYALHLQQLALDASDNGNMVKSIPDTNSLFSLSISKISNLASLPKWPQLPGLKALYIHDCKDLVSLQSGESEGSLRSLTSLEVLSIRDCPNIVTLPNEGLPPTLKYLSINSCLKLESLGLTETLACLTSLEDLYIEDCPMLKSLPEDGVPRCLQHLHIQECPKLTEQCRTSNGDQGPEWPKIENVPDMYIDFPVAARSVKSSWYHMCICGKGFEMD